MNYKIIRLLFDPRGTSGRREFQSGVIILFLLVLCILFNVGLNSGLNIFIGRYNQQLMASFQMIKPLSIPLLPIGFVLFYSSMALAVKRVKDVGGRRWLGVFAGGCVFLFFDATFLKAQTNVTLLSNLTMLDISDSVKTFHLSMAALATIIGLVALILLLTLKGAKVDAKRHNKDRGLAISPFIPQLGLLCLVLSFISVVLGLLYDFVDSEWIIGISSVVALFGTTWYLLLVYMRLKNAEQPFYLFFLCFIIYVLSLVSVGIVFSKSYNLNLINISLSVQSVVNIVFAFANVLLFVLKESTPVGIKDDNKI